MSDSFGSSLPSLVVPPPGPRSLELSGELRRYESPNVTYLAPDFPVFWSEARGANVWDVDGNVFVDLTSAFAVASAGHAHPRIVAAVTQQAARLMHGMGDVHPPEVKVSLLRRLAEVAPGDLNRSILTSSGAEAVEAALKTAAIATGRPKFVAFVGGYHGLTMGSLAVSSREDFRAPFGGQLADIARFAPYPNAFRGPVAGGRAAEESLRRVLAILDGPDGDKIGAIIAEPIQGRGGDIVPPDGWLQALRRICDERGLLLILDEIYTGFGRTGRWFACEHWGVVPDILVVGKGLTGGMPFAACIGTDAVMSAWPVSTGEAIHTSTFLGHPLGCAAALASIEVLRSEGLVERAASEGAWLQERLRGALADNPRVGDIRGRGLMIGIDLVRDRVTRDPDPQLAGRVVTGALRRGFLLLSGGLDGNVLSLSPPFVITREQLEAAVAVIVDLLDEAGRQDVA